MFKLHTDTNNLLTVGNIGNHCVIREKGEGSPLSIRWRPLKNFFFLNKGVIVAKQYKTQGPNTIYLG